MNGILNVLKPPGMTSHDVVAYVRRLTASKAGHAGTLDPAAAGVLVIGVGSGTRLLEFVVGTPKVYRAEIGLGVTTDTQDAEGQVVAEADASRVDAASVQQALARLTGHISMVPPMYSAIRHNGRKLYELARAGQTVSLEPREVQVYRFELRSFRPGRRARAVVDVECSRGTYIRSLAQAVGDDLEVGGYLVFLLRTQVGPYVASQALALEELRAAAESGRLEQALCNGDEVLQDFPRVIVDGEVARRLALGTVQCVPACPVVGPARIMTGDGRLLCLADIREAEGGFAVQPRKVFSQEL